MVNSDLARRLHMRANELDLVLKEREHAKRVKLTEVKGKLFVGLRRD